MKLIGTIHMDFEGVGRLERALKEFQPSSIGLEAPDEDLSKVVETIRAYNKRFLELAEELGASPEAYQLLSDIYTTKGYELAVAIDYHNETKCDIVGVDNKPFELHDPKSITIEQVKEELDVCERLLAGSSLNAIKSTVIKTTDHAYSETDYNPINHLTEEREAHIARRVLETRPEVAILGTGHVFGKDFGIAPAHLRVEEHTPVERYSLHNF